MTHAELHNILKENDRFILSESIEDINKNDEFIFLRFHVCHYRTMRKDSNCNGCKGQMIIRCLSDNLKKVVCWNWVGRYSTPIKILQPVDFIEEGEFML